MNCVNCGAAPQIDLPSCLYCGTALAQRVVEADHDGFALMLRTLRITDADFYKEEIVKNFRGKFTAGQVRRLLSTFDSDIYRMGAAKHLASRTTNPARLIGCADLFDTDFYRRDFTRLLGGFQVAEEAGNDYVLWALIGVVLGGWSGG